MSIITEHWEGYSFIVPAYDKLLTIPETDYWTDIFVKNLKVGIEIEAEFPRSRSLEQVNRNLRDALKPINNISGISEHGVNSIKRDGSLSHGVEITTVGKRIHFWELFNQINYILRQLKSNGAKITPRCGLHTHLLISYYDDHKKELEKPIPGIIFKNFYNLLKRHLPELVFLTAALNKHEWEAITRYEHFCMAKNLMGFHNNKLTNELITGINAKYSFLNPYNMQVLTDGNSLKNFHVELRFADSTLVANQIVSMAILYASMVIKAIELSKYGLVGCGSDHYWGRTKVLYKEIRNDNGLGFVAQEKQRTSVTPDQSTLDEIQQRTKNLILTMKQTTNYFDKNAYQVLSKMSGYPVYQQLINRKKYDDIDKFLTPKDKREKKDFAQITQIIDTFQIIGCKNKTEWESKVAKLCGVNHRAMTSRIWKLNRIRKLIFDPDLGAVIFIE